MAVQLLLSDYMAVDYQAIVDIPIAVVVVVDKNLMLDKL
jgi:hypothetical protein